MGEIDKKTRIITKNIPAQIHVEVQQHILGAAVPKQRRATRNTRLQAKLMEPFPPGQRTIVRLSNLSACYLRIYVRHLLEPTKFPRSGVAKVAL